MHLEPALIVQTLRETLPGLLAAYGFGSRVRGVAGPGSDLDVAVLVTGYADALTLWNLSSTLAGLTGCEVDVLDLRAASTVMQYQVITTGVRWWAKDLDASLYEAAILSEKTELDTARAGLLRDIQAAGTVYGG